VSRSPRARTAAAVIGALIGAVALAGCGAGQLAATASQVAAVGGANATVGQIAVRNAVVAFDGPAATGTAYEVGGSAPLTMSIVNQGQEADRLVSVSSPAASAVEVGGTREVPAGQVLVVDGGPAPAAEDESGEPEATESGAATDEEADAAAQAASAGEPQAQIVLTGLRERIRPGLAYVVVLTFERAGEIRLELPVANPDEPRPAPAEAAAH
jgi:hypothetical protein